MVVLDGDVSIGDAGEGRCDAEVVDETLPRVVVMVGFVNPSSPTTQRVGGDPTVA
jgi:hypothetical protein